MQIEALQHYFRAIADADLEHPDVLHVIAALGHNGTTHNNVLQLLVAQMDWASFLSPAQTYAHTLVQQLRVAWGAVADSLDVAVGNLFNQAPLVLSPEQPPTLWLTTALRGAGKRASVASDGGGDEDPSKNKLFAKRIQTKSQPQWQRLPFQTLQSEHFVAKQDPEKKPT